ncbi:MAG: sugar phosphate nucleotidyltransferase [Candidatus Dojkabacteria bacterium]|nr:sugar phosphate nucleotidyltransferase [Candidatus Dojkabacteria bacterium]
MKVIILANENSLKTFPTSDQSLLEGCVEMFRGKDTLIQAPSSIRCHIERLVSKIKISYEPVQKGTAFAIGLALIKLLESSSDEVVSIVYSDHPVSYKEKLLRTLEKAEQLHKALDKLMFVGVNPTFASSDYGYIKIGKVLQELNGSIAFEMDEFIEKPSRKEAGRFLESWRFLWNSGYVVGRISFLLRMFEELQPDIFKGLMTIRQSIGTDVENEITTTVFKSFSPLSIDKGIYERVARNKVGVIPVDLGIHDFADYT